MCLTVLCSAALVARPAFASICKPRFPSGSTTASIESATSSLPSGTSTELQTTATGATRATSADVSSTIATSISNGDSTTEAEATATATSAEETTSLEPSIATTMIAETNAIEAAFEPVPTFDVLGKGAQVDEVNGNILCIQYGETGDANLLKTCSNNMLNQPDYNTVTWEQTRDRELQCSVPTKTCTTDFDTFETTCSTLSETFDMFYTVTGRNDGIFLAMAGAVNPGTNYQAVELAITPSESK
ncbi:hypothetical protein FoTM2_013801 [Fusarium oxysporum f. sp. vasinfectum]|nr:hypothetical protein FoTM2_013801 [Fusarium oxysporum f. sp. vasinfectum]